METFLIKSAITMAVLLGLYYLLLEREKMHKFNRFYLLGALVFSLAIPFTNIPIYVKTTEAPVVAKSIEFNAPVVQESLTVQQMLPAQKEIAQATITQPDVNYVPYILIGIYCLISIVLLIRFFKNISHFIALAHKSEREKYKEATLVLLNNKVLPHTFLNYIFISKEEYTDNAIEEELYSHELTHVKQKHSIDILFIEALKIVFWFNPLLYVYKKAIQLNHEFLADDRVLSTSGTTHYQQLLLQKASYPSGLTLASNLNFSITKKRFIMMTKTTPKAKGIVLKLSALCTVSMLLYSLGTHTVAYAETATGKTILTPEPTNTFDDITIVPEESLTEEVITEQKTTVTKSDTLSGDARRDEYYAGVKIVIDDKLRNVYISDNYENIPLQHKRYYLSSIPEKKKAEGVSSEDYDYAIKTKDATFYLDEQKISLEQLLKYKKEDFAYFGMKMSGTTKPGGKMEQVFQYFFYSYPYFKKNVSSVNDHYPGEVCQIMITDKPKEYLELHADDAKTTQKDGADKMKDDVIAQSYSFTNDIKARNHNASAQFPGGEDKFNEYLVKNLNQNILKGKVVTINFDIETDGSITDISLRNNNDPAIETEVKRVMANCPKWIPGQINGKPAQTATSWKFPDSRYN